jgi:hypothetical protein
MRDLDFTGADPQSFSGIQMQMIICGACIERMTRDPN